MQFPFEINPRGIHIINEGDLYRLIMRSQLPHVDDFRDWVCDEVLPEIRKTGSYSMMGPQDYLEALEAHFLSEKKRILLERQIEKNKPLVTFAKHVTNTCDAIDIGTFAKILHDQERIRIGRNKLYRWMYKNKFLMENKFKLPYQTFIDRGYFNVVETVYNTAFGKRIEPRTLVTGMGQVYFCNKLKKEFGCY